MSQPMQDLASSETSDSSSVASTPNRTGRNKPRRGLPYYIQGGRKRDRSSLTGKLKGKDRDMQEKTIQLVLAGQPTGWTAMAHAVRNFDEEKVKDCKEDVDTLLVFAGLFSAVLTAFLIESYNNLLEDPATQTLVAIRQLVTQTASYKYEAGMLNSSASPLVVEAFQASSTDIRVNVFWFASLLFSLITASFGILVKQWLREYLAAENPSSQARLRVRHLRHPQLSQWKVFEIAAVSPLLLQLSLALFFIGLCFFTASVHPSVKYTTLPLVVGCAFCLCTVTILPLFFPQCPYRTALLKAGVQALHRRTSTIAKTLEIYCRTAVTRSAPSSYRLKERLLVKVEGLSKRLSVFLAGHDEARVMRRTDKDVEILGTVDTIQSDDELLGTAIADALDHLNCRPQQFEDFLRTVLENRGHPSAPVASCSPLQSSMSRPINPFPVPILDLRRLSKPTQNAVCTVISHYATNARLNRGPFESLMWEVDRMVYRTVLMCMIMLAVSDCPCPEDGLYVIGGSHFRYNGLRSMQRLLRNALDTSVLKYDSLETGRNISEDKPLLLLEGLGKLWDHFDAGTNYLLHIVVSAIEQYGGVDNDGVPRLRYVGDVSNVDGWALDHLTPQTNLTLMGLLVHGAAGILRREHGTFVGANFNISAVLRGILRLSYSGQYCQCELHVEDSVDFLLSALLARQDLALVLVDTMLQAPSSWVRLFTERFPDRLPTHSPPAYGVDMYALDWNARLDNLTAAISTRLSGSETGVHVSSIDAFKICYFAVGIARFLFIVQPPREQWATLFDALLGRIDSPTEGNKSLLDEDKAAVADQMLEMMHWAEENSPVWTLTKDGDDEVYREWANSEREKDSIFPDRLLESIAPHSSRVRKFGPWAVRRALEAVEMKAVGEVWYPFPFLMWHGW